MTQEIKRPLVDETYVRARLGCKFCGKCKEKRGKIKHGMGYGLQHNPGP